MLEILCLLVVIGALVSWFVRMIVKAILTVMVAVCDTMIRRISSGVANKRPGPFYKIQIDRDGYFDFKEVEDEQVQ